MTLTDTIRDGRSAGLAILLTVTAEIVFFVVALIAGDKIDDFRQQEDSFYLLLGPPFLVGLIFSFAVWRMLQPKFRLPENKWLASNFVLWTVAVGGGLFNTMALYFLYMTS